MQHSIKYVMAGLMALILAGCGAATTGMESFTAGNYDQAIGEFTSCADSEGDTGVNACYCQFMLGKSYYEKGRYPEAISYLKKAIENLSGKSCDTYGLGPAYYYWLGMAYLDTNQPKDAIPNFEKAGAISSQNPASTMPAEATVWRENMLPLIPPKAACYFKLGTAYYQVDRYQDGVNAIKQAIDLDPTPIDFYTTLAGCYRELKQYDEAAATVKRSIEIKPSGFAYNTLASIKIAQKKYGEAAEAYKQAIALEPKNLYSYHLLFNTYIEMQNSIEAMAVLQKALENCPIDKNVYRIYLQLAMVYNFSGKYGDAIEAADKGISLLSGQPIGIKMDRGDIQSKEASGILARRSFALREIGKIEESYMDAEKAHSLDPEDFWAKFAIAVTYIDQGRFKDAQNILTPAEGWDMGRILLSTTYAKSGDMKKAADIYGSVSKAFLSTKSAVVQSHVKALSELLAVYVASTRASAKELESRGSYREALQQYAEALKGADEKGSKEIRHDVGALIKNNPYLADLPEDARKYAVRGEALLKDGKVEDALKEFDSAVRIAQFVPQLYFNTALVHGELKNYKAAIRMMTAYLDLSQGTPNLREVQDQIYKWELMIEREGK